MKKVLSVVLAVLMMFSMMSAAFAATENKPVANINLIKGTAFADTEGFKDFPVGDKDLDYLVGAVFSVNQLGDESFEDFLVDFKLTAGADMEAEFYGKYGTGTEYNKWMQPGEYDGEADGFQKVIAGEHHLFEEYGVKNLLTIEKVRNIETFYCALYVKPGSVDGPVDVSLGLDMFEKPEKGQDPVYEDVKVSPESVQEIKVAMERPTAIIKMVEGRDFATTPGFEDFAEKCGIDNIDMNYVIGAYIDVEKMGTGYDDYFVDFILNFSNNAKGRYFGKYTGNFSTGTVTYDWSYDSVPADITAGATSILSALNYAGSKMTVKEACTCVSGGFYSALYIDPSSVSAPITVSMDAAVYQEPEQGKPVVTEVVKASADSVKEAEVAFTKPVANITMVDGKDFANTEVFKDFPLEGVNTDYLVGAIVKVADKGEGFDNYLVDFNIDLSAAVKAKFYGAYTYNKTTKTYPWQAASNDYADIPAGGYNLLDSSNPLGIKINVAEAAEEIGTFYCALLIDPNSVNSVVTATLNTIIFEAPAEGEAPEFITLATDIASKNTIETCSVNPVANITMVDGKDFAATEGFKDFAAAYAENNNGEQLNMGNVIGAVLKVNNGGQGFEDFMVDFKLNLSEAVNAKFYGKYNYRGTDTGWQGTTDYQPVPAGDSYLLDSTGDSFSKAKLSVAEVVKDVDTFYCAFVIDPTTADDVVKAKLDVVICEKGKDVKTEAIVVENDNKSNNEAEACRVAPTAEIKMVKGANFATTDGFTDFDTTGLDTDYLVGAYIDIAALGTGYEDNFIDFILNLDAPVEAMFFGKYTAEFRGETKVYDWTSTGTFSPINAGSTNILSDINYPGSQMTLQEAYDCVKGGFYCAFYVKPDSVSAPVTVSLTPAVYKEAAGERVMAEPTKESVLTEKVALVKPVADVTMVAGKDFATTEGFKDFNLTGINTDYLVGAVLKVTGAGKGFENYIVDFKLDLSSEVSAKFLGKYDYDSTTNYWQGTSDYFDVPAGGVYLLNSESDFGITRTVAEVANEVKTFYCALIIDPDSVNEIVNATLDVVMYETPAEGKEPEFIVVTDEACDNTAETCFKAPVANITMIDGKDFADNAEFADFAKAYGSELDMNNVVGAILNVSEEGRGYEDAMVDFKLNLSEEVNAKFYGKYYFKEGSTGWQGTTDFKPVPAGDSYILNAPGVSFEKANLTVAEVARDVKTFYCVLVIDPDSASGIVTAKLDVAAYEKGTDITKTAVVLPTDENSNNSAEVCKVNPVANITMIKGADFGNTDVFDEFDTTDANTDYLVGAVIELTEDGLGFDDYLVDFKLTPSSAVKAMLFGAYTYGNDEYDWRELHSNYADISEDGIFVLNAADKSSGYRMNIAEIDEKANKLYCALYIDPDTASDVVNVELDVVMFADPAEAEAPDYIVVTDEAAVNTIEVCAEVPGVNITMVEGKNFCNNPEFADFATAYGDDIDMNNVVGAVLKVKDAGKGYDDYMVDFKLNLSEAVKAKFFGKYYFKGESTGWQGTSDFTDVPAGESYLLNAPGNSFDEANLTVAQVVRDVDTFYCVLVVDPDSAKDVVTAAIDVVMYEKETDVAETAVVLEKDDASDNTADVCNTNPVVDIKLIPGREFSKNFEFKNFAKESGIANLNMDCVVGAEITLISKGTGFDESLVDFALGLSEDVDAKLYGKFYYSDYDFYDWTALTENYENISADGMYVLRSASDDKFLMNVSEVDEMVGTFYCVLVVDPDSASDVVDVTLDAVVYDKPAAGADPVYNIIDTTDASVTAAEVCRIRPVVDIKMIDGADFEKNDVFDEFDLAGIALDTVVGAKMTITDMGKFCDDSLVDFRLNLSDDVEAKVYGSYVFNEGKANEKAYAWTSLTGDEYAQFKAGDNYVLDFDTELHIEDLTLTEVKENVGTFYCVFVINPSPMSTDYEAINTTLDLVVYDEPADGAAVEYFAADCDTDNKAILLGGWDVVVDGDVDVIDYQAVVNIALGNTETYTDKEISSADIDSDGYVDVLDAVLVERVYKRD